jgi:predicted metal-dependent hydrolase
MKETIFISVIIIFIYIFLFLNYNNVSYIKASNGGQFLIHKDSDRQLKADLLEKVVNNLYLLKDHMIYNIKKFPEYEEYINQLGNQFNKNRTIIYETDPSSSLTSYSINKGEEISFCLRSKKTNLLHDINLIMYVAIHELSHIACPVIGHGSIFKMIFKKLLEEAIILGIYKHVDYSINPIEYCGMMLTSSII